MAETNFIKFYRGSKQTYVDGRAASPKVYSDDVIYFATDSREILLKDKSYGVAGSYSIPKYVKDINLASDGKTMVITYVDDSVEQTKTLSFENIINLVLADTFTVIENRLDALENCLTWNGK